MGKNAFDVKKLDGALARLDKMEKVKKPVSFRKMVFELYPKICEAIGKGWTRKEVFEAVFDESIRSRVSLVTFYDYLKQAERAAVSGKSVSARPVQVAQSVQVACDQVCDQKTVAPVWETVSVPQTPVQSVQSEHKSEKNEKTFSGSEEVQRDLAAFDEPARKPIIIRRAFTYDEIKDGTAQREIAKRKAEEEARKKEEEAKPMNLYEQARQRALYGK